MGNYYCSYLKSIQIEGILRGNNFDKFLLFYYYKDINITSINYTFCACLFSNLET